MWANARLRAQISGYQSVADETATRLLEDGYTVFKITRPVRLIESEEWRVCERFTDIWTVMAIAAGG